MCFQFEYLLRFDWLIHGAPYIFESHNDRFEKQQKQQVQRGGIDSFCYLAINIKYKDKPSQEELDIYVNCKHISLQDIRILTACSFVVTHDSNRKNLSISKRSVVELFYWYHTNVASCFATSVFIFSFSHKQKQPHGVEVLLHTVLSSII